MTKKGTSLLDHDLFELPIAVYHVRHNGFFISGNRRLRQLLQLPEGPIDNQSIAQFYKNPKDRLRLLEKVRFAESQGKLLEKEITLFVINGHEHFFQVYCRTLRGASHKEPEYLGCLIDVTDEERLKSLVDQLPAGIFKTDESNRLTHVNDALVRMFGFDSKVEMEGKFLEDFYVTHQAIEESESGQQIREFKGKDEKHFLALIRSRQIFNADGRHSGYEGTIEDVTEREILRELINQTPLGLYKVLLEGDQHIIKNCNDSFADLFGFGDGAQLIGRDIRDLHKGESGVESFMAALRAQEAQGLPLLNYTIRTTSLTGKKLTLEANCRLLRDKVTGEEIGRIGVLRDATSQEETLRLISDFTKDIGNVLHTYESMLVNLRSALNPMRTTLAYETSYLGKNLQDLFQELDLAAEALSNTLNRLLDLIDSEGRDEAFSEKEVSSLRRALDLARSYKDRIVFKDFQATTFHSVGHKLMDLSLQTRRREITRDLIRRLRRESWEMARLCSLISLAKIEDAVLMMDYQVRGLREFVTKGVRRKEPAVACTLESLMHQAISNVSEFARLRRVEFRASGPLVTTRVLVQEREVVRALSNLLHNAVKYSWARTENDPPWVAIRCRLEGEKVHVEVENYGVPIPSEEISTDLIFQTGMRGRLAGDRGRIGTGIGLGDARAVARAQGGEVTIRSRPARAGAREDDYSKPFLTTSEMVLSVYTERH